MDIRISNARISFANGLWNASAAVEGGIPKYNCDFIVTPDSKVERKTAEGKWVSTSLKEAQRLVAEEAFKGDAKKASAWFEDLDARQKSVRVGDKNKDKAGDVRQGYEGNLYVHATSKTLMPVYRGDKSIVAREEDSPIYSGCYVNMQVELWAQENTNGKGLRATLLGIQKVRDGDAFGGGSAPNADDFGEVTEGADAADLT